jgi:superfamily II DNA helicase RecQ
LIATDIVARGIDVDDIPLVINYDVPRDAEDYYTALDEQLVMARKAVRL